MTEEKAKSLIGRKVRGFEFESNAVLLFTPNMKNYIGVTGKILDFEEYDFLVDFGDIKYYYPSSLIEAHLVEEELISESHLVQIEGEDFSYKTVNITASELINQNEQLKAENAELVKLLNTIIYKRDSNYYIGLEGDSMIQLSENLIKIWENGK